MSVVEIDARGLVCPLPLLRLQKVLSSAEAGQEFALITDDPAAVRTVRDFCQQGGASLLAQDERAEAPKGEVFCHRLQKL